MGRRSLGFLVIVLGVVAAVVVSAAAHRVGPGRAVAAPERAPVVGDCLLTPASAVSTGGLPTAAVTILAGCDGPRFGEVVHVGAVLETESATCANSARSYVGLPRAVAFGPWAALPALQDLVISPTWAQQTTGHQWAACVAYVGDTELPLSLAHLLDQWISASPLSQCSYDPGVTELRDAQCSAPHRTEVLGTAAVDAPLPDLNTSCRELAAAATRMADPTAGGGLRVQTAVTHDASPGASTAGLGPTGEGTATCEIVAAGGRTLTGPLLGLGTHAVPWA